MSRKVVDFGPDQFSAIKRLAKRYGRTESEIVRAGVALFQVATRETSRGNGIAVVDGERVVSRLIGVWDEAQPEPVGA